MLFRQAVRCAVALLLVLAITPAGGCVVAGLVAAMGRSAESQKLIEVPARYAGLEDRSVAVLADADMEVLYENPYLIQNVAYNVSLRIAQNVPGATVMSPQDVIAWQYATPQWSAMPYGEIAESLNVDRIVHIDIYEYRLNPPGNSWLWDGVCAADVGIIERDAMDPDSFYETFQVRSAFPDMQGVGRDAASRSQIETGVLTRFMQRASWLFYTHLEPKHPDEYRPDL